MRDRTAGDATHPALAALLRRTGLLGAHLDGADAREIAAAATAGPLGATLDRILASSSKAALAAAVRVQTPALVLAGDADPLMPAALAQQLGRSLPRSRVRILRGGGHFVTRELPDLVNLELARFIGHA